MVKQGKRTRKTTGQGKGKRQPQTPLDACDLKPQELAFIMTRRAWYGVWDADALRKVEKTQKLSEEAKDSLCDLVAIFALESAYGQRRGVLPTAAAVRAGKGLIGGWYKAQPPQVQRVFLQTIQETHATAH